MSQDYMASWKQNYYKSLCSGLEQQWRTNQYTDTKVIVGERSFNCHRVILAAMSPFFEAMYLSGMRESQDGVVTLQDVEPSTFESILKFIYTGDDVVDGDNADLILRASVELQIRCLQQRCEEFMTDNVDPENCLATWKLASVHACSHLSKTAWKYLLYYFADIWQTDDFLKIDHEDLLSLIKDNNLKTPNEETVCDAVFRWIDHDKDNRQQYIGKLFEHLRLPLLQPEYLLERIETDSLVQQTDQCKQIVEEAKRYHLLPARRHEFVSSRLLHRNHGEYEEIIICIGGSVHPNRTTREVSGYSMKRMEWIRLAPLPYDMGVEFAVCTHGNAVFVSGGSEVLNGMVYFTTTQNCWMNCDRMLIGRRRHCMVAVGDSLFVLGGYDDEENEERFSTLMSVEKFGVMTGSWEDYGYLLFPVRSASAAVVHDKIYIFGGIDPDGVKLPSIQCFDTRLKACSHVSDIPCLSGMSSAVACNRTTYLIFPSGDVIKMEDDGVMESIGNVPNFESRCGFGIVQHEGNILIIGGIDSTDIYDEIVTFDPESKVSEVSDHILMRPLFGFGCVKATLPKNLFR